MATHPLNRPAAWALKLGPADIPLVRWLGTALWALASAMGLSWWAHVARDFAHGHVTLGALAGFTVLMLTWAVVAWRIWRAWVTQAGTLTLLWRGPVHALKSTRSAGHDRESREPEVGFAVAEWQAPVNVRVMLDGQRWMLVRIDAVSQANPLGSDDAAQRHQAYCWVDAHASRTQREAVDFLSIHQLRTLLHLSPSLITHEGVPLSGLTGLALQVRGAVASWAFLFSPRFTLRRFAFSSPAHRQRAFQVSGQGETLFPPTMLLDEHGPAGQLVRVSREGQA